MSNANFGSFQEAGKAVLSYLHKRFGFSLWMITRVESDNWIVLQSETTGYDIQPGQVFRWADSFCAHMVTGDAPKIVPRSEDIPLYAAAPIAKQVSIRAYIGQPLLNEDGSLFGTLCAIDPYPKPDSIIHDADLIEVFGGLLSRILQVELRENEQIRQYERLQVEALSDVLTGLYNRRAWDRLVNAEEERCKRHGHPAAVFIIDLNGLKEVNDNLGHVAGDRFIRQAAEILKNNARSNDIVARLGGDEFGILSIENNQAGAELLLQRMLKALEEGGVSAAVGYVMRHPSKGLLTAVTEADQKMFEHKRRIKSNLN